MAAIPDATISVQAPYEGLMIAAIGLVEKLIDGQTPEQRAKIWDQWITFWAPIVNLMRPRL